jgi:ribosomal protein L11 methyltransferase
VKPSRPRTYVRLHFDTPAASADRAAAILVAHGALGCEVAKIRPSRPVLARRPRRVRLKTYFERLGEGRLRRVRDALEAAGIIAARDALQTETIVDPGWATMWMTRFEPFTVGRLLIVPPWSRERRAGFVRLVIQPGQGFGTGHHATTYGVLCTLDELCAASRFKRALDLGTGSGILAIAMRLLGVDEIVALEIDPIALDNARENADLNRVSRHLRFSNVPLISIRGRFDLITANILSSTLIELAPRLKPRLAAHGRLILSGILAREAPAVIAAYRTELHCVGRRIDRGWATLLMARASA